MNKSELFKSILFFIQSQLGMEHLSNNSSQTKEIGKNLEEFVFFSLKDINNLDFRNKLIIEGDRFLLSEVNSFDILSDQSTKTFLLYDAQIKEEDLDKLEAPNITNKV